MMESEPTPGVLFVGLATVDVLYGVDGVPGPNSKVAALWQEVCAGGPATNAAIACAHLGTRATLATAVGRHPLGAIIRDDLARHGVDLVDLAQDLDLAPPVSAVLIDGRSGDRAVVSANAAVWPPSLLPVPDVAFDGVRLVLADGHHMLTAIETARRARASGLLTIMDGGSWKPGTEALLPHVEIAICSADFLPPGCSTPVDVAASLRAAGVRAIAITRGPDPVLCWEGEDATSLPVPSVEVADTLGAGDILHGAFCAYLTQARGRFRPALAAAVTEASRSCTSRGTRTWMERSASR
jgi:sugar/nucleoside kinase (ribokinase family)